MSSDRITIEATGGPSQLSFAVDGVELFRIVSGGNLVLGVELDEVSEAARLFWQALLDEAGKHGFRIEGGETSAALFREASMLSLALVEAKQEAYRLREHLRLLCGSAIDDRWTLTPSDPWMTEARRLAGAS